MSRVAVSALLSLLALAGIALQVLSGGFMTVDGLFYTLILGAIFAIFAFNCLYYVRRWRMRKASAKPGTGQATKADAPPVAATNASAAATASAAKETSAVTTVPEKVPASQRRAAPRVRSQKPSISIDGLASGSVLVKNSTPIPDAIAARPHPCLARESSADSRSAAGWKLLDCQSAGLERSLRPAGLDIFYLVGAIESSGWATDQRQALRNALAPVLAATDAQGRNAVEIDHVSATRRVGLCHVTLRAHARHIQKTSVVLDAPETPRPKLVQHQAATSASEGVAPARAA